MDSSIFAGVRTERDGNRPNDKRFDTNAVQPARCTYGHSGWIPIGANQKIQVDVYYQLYFRDHCHVRNVAFHRRDTNLGLYSCYHGGRIWLWYIPYAEFACGAVRCTKTAVGAWLLAQRFSSRWSESRLRLLSWVLLKIVRLIWRVV